MVVDATAKTAVVAAGARLLALDTACAPHGLATVMGTNPDTGVAGLTLNGGMGHLCRWVTRGGGSLYILYHEHASYFLYREHALYILYREHAMYSC